jgi:hypothetical protein
MRLLVLITVLVLGLVRETRAQSADWTEVIWRDPQVRYLLADMTLNGGKTDLYRKYAKEERDPDSIEAIRLWDGGARVVNTNDFERRWVTNKHGKDGRVMRVVLRGTDRTIVGTEVLLTSDPGFNQGIIRLALAEMSMGRPRDYYAKLSDIGDIREALRRWDAGVRLINTNWFTLAGPVSTPELVYRETKLPVDPTHIRLNSDVPWPETNVRYFMADIALGGSIEFYRAAAERDHEMGCLEAVRRTEEAFKITNLDQFERKKVNGKTLITRKGSNERISGMLVKLSSD